MEMRYYLEKVAVELVMFASGGALDVVPPIASEKLLAEDGAVGAEEGVLPTADIAYVKHLLKRRKTNHIDSEQAIIVANKLS